MLDGVRRPAPSEAVAALRQGEGHLPTDIGRAVEAGVALAVKGIYRKTRIRPAALACHRHHHGLGDRDQGSIAAKENVLNPTVRSRRGYKPALSDFHLSRLSPVKPTIL
jgi:hypothetical protein